VKALFPRAAALGKHVMIGGIDAENAQSIHLHRKLGFEPVAHLREVGRKFDRWLDLVFVQRPLTQADRDATVRGGDADDRV
jgi:L-amino acid N-acyltransferase YncA